MHDSSFLVQAFTYLLAAVLAVPVARRLGLGSVLGYLIAGLAIGPWGLGLVGQEGQDVMQFAEFGVVMMLFVVGLELEPALLWRLRGALLGMGGLQVGITAALVAAVAAVAGMAWQAAVAIGLTLALSSTAIVLQSLAEKGLLKTDAGQRAFAVLLFQDLAVIPILALLPLLAVAGAGEATAPHGPAWLEALPAWGRGAVVLGAVAAVVVGGHYLLGPVFRALARTRLREVFTAAALLLVVGIALLMTMVGLSPALGTFLAGVVLATSEFRHELQGDIEPFKGLLLGLFFLAVGASIDFGLVGSRPMLTAGLVLGLVAVKFAVLLGLGRAFRMGLDQNLLFALALAQGGEFCFVLLAFAVQSQVLEPGTGNLLIAVVALSMALTPVLLLAHDRLLQPWLGTRAAPPRPADTVDHPEAPVVIAGFGRFGSTVGRLLAANGIRATVLDHDSDNVETLRRLGLEVYYGDASREELLRAAGAGQARLIVLAVDDPDKNLAMAHTIRRHFPGATLLARAHGRSDAYALMEAGVDHVVRETLDSSLRLGVEALRLLGIRGYQAHRAAQAFRRHDEAALRELGGMRHDRGAYLSRARERIRDLEQSLQVELDRGTARQDSAWDAESLRREFNPESAAEG